LTAKQQKELGVEIKDRWDERWFLDSDGTAKIED
jgi:hypothetical protein